MIFIYRKLILLSFIFSMSSVSFAEESDSLRVIGDDLDLYAVLDAFKNAESMEAFEKSLNDPNGKISNLDLDQDGEVDYIKVVDNVDEDAHAIILRIDVSEEESQDVAVIEVEKTSEGEVNIQIVGDEDLYGEDYIVEPSEEVTKGHMPPAVIIVNVWHWPCVKFIYGPGYRPWVSPWRYRHYPVWWKPWKPYKWGVYHGFHAHYRHVRVHRMSRAHKVYHNHRKAWGNIQNHPHHHHHKNKEGHNNNNGNKPHNHKKNNTVHKKSGTPHKKSGGKRK